jgi:O-antigen/teichoic acid export membrane protein
LRLPRRRDGVSIAVALRSPLTRNAYFLTLNTGVNAGLGVAYWALAARLFAKSDVGAAGALVSLMVLLASLSQYNLGQGLPRLLQVHGNHARRLVTASYVACSCTGLLLAGGVMTAWGATRTGVLGSTSVIVWCAFAFAVAQWTVFTLQDAVLTGLRRASMVPLENMLFGLLKLATLLLIGVHLGQGGIFWSWVLAVPLVVVPLNLLIFRRYLPVHEHNSAVGELDRSVLVRYVSLEYAGSICAQAASNLLPVIVAARLGAIQNAEFYTAWVVILALDTLGANFATSFSVEAARAPHRFHALLAHAQRRTAQTLLPLLLVVLVGAPALLRVFGATYAVSSTPLLRVMVIGCALKAVNSLAVGMHRAWGAAGQVLKIQALVAAFVLPLAMVLVPRLGVLGVAWAYTLCNALAAVVSFRDLRRAGGSRLRRTAPETP